jgi:hypothetical protein
MQATTARALNGSGVANNLGATRVFGPFPVQGRRLSMQASWTGTPTGTFSLETSFDGASFTPIPGAAAEFTASGNAQPAGAASSATWNWLNVPGTMVQLRYTATGGTGTLTVRAAQGF